VEGRAALAAPAFLAGTSGSAGGEAHPDADPAKGTEVGFDAPAADVALGGVAGRRE
jgi:hypothetical protein